MVKVVKVLDTVIFNTCKVNREIVECPDGSHMEWKAAYSLVDGSYIGDTEWAQYFEKNGIIPQRKRSDCNVASIGFCAKTQKWHGWSQRGSYGFGVGSEIKKGHCAYKPCDPQDLLEDMIRFWVDEENENVEADVIVKQELDVPDPHNNRPGLGALLITRTVRKKDGKVLESTHWEPYPDVWGKGEWVANTLEEAKQMAIDYSDGVS